MPELPAHAGTFCDLFRLPTEGPDLQGLLSGILRMLAPVSGAAQGGDEGSLPE
jgi:hypothetical protein